MIVAKQDTLIKKDWSKNENQLSQREKRLFKEGDSLKIWNYQELDINSRPNYAQIDCEDYKGWYIDNYHWAFPWQTEIDILIEGFTEVEWEEIDWSDINAPISIYYRAGNVILEQFDRIPFDEEIQQNIVKVARELDKVREWWGSPLLLQSWYRPLEIDRKCGGDRKTYPTGLAVTLRPGEGSVYEFQSKFLTEYFRKDLWEGGFGLAAHKGYVHLDLINQFKHWKIT